MLLDAVAHVQLQTRGIRSLLGVLLVTTLLAGVAEGQAPDDPTAFRPEAQAAVETDDTPVVPATGIKEVPWTVELSCEASQVPPMSPVTVGFEAGGSALAEVVIDRTTAPVPFESDDCVEEKVHTIEGVAEVYFDAEAPAGEPHSFFFAVRYDGEEVARAEWTEVPAAYARLKAALGQTIYKIDRGDVVPVEMTFDLETNLPLQICFRWMESQWDVPTPDCIKGDPEGAASLAFDVRSSDDVKAGIYAFTMRSTATGEEDGSGPELDTSVTTFLVRVEGFPRSPEELPAPAVLASLGVPLALLALAVVRRR